LDQLLQLRKLHRDGVKQLLKLLMLNILQLLQLLHLLRKRLQYLNDLLQGLRDVWILRRCSLSAEERRAVGIELLGGITNHVNSFRV
jgi:hypothetical protein